MATDVYLVGSGIKSALQVTRETEQALRHCRVAFVLHDDLMVHDHIATLCNDVRDLAYLYEGADVRSTVYRQISETLVAEASTAGGPVALVAHGHPLFLVSATEYTLELCHARGLTVEVLPGVSSFDTILCDLRIDYGYGIQVFDATTLIRNSWQPNPQIPTLIFQLATTMVDQVVMSDPAPSILLPLVKHLRGVYGGDHVCSVVYSAAQLLEGSSVVHHSLDDLATSDAVELWRRPTLYIPAVR